MLRVVEMTPRRVYQQTSEVDGRLFEVQNPDYNFFSVGCRNAKLFNPNFMSKCGIPLI